MNTEILGLSIDSNSSHLAWMEDIFKRTGIFLQFPIVADRSGEIARLYGMISKEVSNTKTVRDVIIIDPDGIIRIILTYPLNVGRNIAEIIRAVQALQIADCQNASTPVNWIEGNPLIVNSPQTYPELVQRKKDIEEIDNGFSWYLSFKKPE